jgi:hypothetical protein
MEDFEQGDLRSFWNYGNSKFKNIAFKFLISFLKVFFYLKTNENKMKLVN